MLSTFKRAAIPAVRKHYRDAKDAFAICDLPGLAELADSVPKSNHNRRDCDPRRSWYGNKSYNDSVAQIRSGDLAGVAASDKLIDAIEIEAPMTHAWQVRHDVVGGVPNVAAYLAGHPLCMRRRERTTSEQAPLSIVVSLELSGGIAIEHMRKRGAAILALVRRLSNVRPVELFVCCSIGNRPGYVAAHTICRVDTAPLDLARAAHVLTCPSVTRGIGYASGGYLLNKHGLASGEWSGNWAYGDDSVYRRNAREILSSVVAPNADVLYITAAHSNDPAVTNPIQWLKDKIAEYGGLAEAA